MVPDRFGVALENNRAATLSSSGENGAGGPEIPEVAITGTGWVKGGRLRLGSGTGTTLGGRGIERCLGLASPAARDCRISAQRSFDWGTMGGSNLAEPESEKDRGWTEGCSGIGRRPGETRTALERLGRPCGSSIPEESWIGGGRGAVKIGLGCG